MRHNVACDKMSQGMAHRRPAAARQAASRLDRGTKSFLKFELSYNDDIRIHKKGS